MAMSLTEKSAAMAGRAKDRTDRLFFYLFFKIPLAGGAV